jgi:predicted transglutaminase-like cysteine proteinase
MNRAVALRALSALALGTLAFPAMAESSPLGANVAKPYQVISKTEAILGGSSRLAAIMASQGGVPERPLNAALSVTPSGPGAGFASQMVAAPRPVPFDRPDVFGSVALVIGSTPLDDRWHKVSQGHAGGAAAAYATSMRDHEPLARIDAVNRYVNARVQFVNDITLFGSEDRWMSGSETLGRGQGDCEDFAIAKLQMLRKAGFEDKDLYLVVLRDMRRAADHAVLVVRAEGRLLVLDNGTNRIVDSETMSDYKPILTYSGNRAWTHGYRRVAPAITYASAAPVSAPVAVAHAASPQVDLDSVAIAAATLPVASLAMPF